MFLVIRRAFLIVRHEDSRSPFNNVYRTIQTHQVTNTRDQMLTYVARVCRRALNIVEDAINRGFLPPFTVDHASCIDLTQMTPTVAEAYTLAIVAALERRAARARSAAGAESGAAGDGQLFFHKISLMVPPFEMDKVLWPSYVPKLNIRRKVSMLHTVRPNHAR